MHPLKKFLISQFIALNLLCMARPFLPMQSKSLSTLFSPIDAYLAFFNLTQDWTMLAPSPSKEDFFLTAKVEFNDGSFKAYEFEYFPEPNLLHRYMRGERLRKITSDGITKDGNKFMWRDMAKFAMEKVKDSNSKTPSKVFLYLHKTVTPDISEQFLPHSHLKTNYSSLNFYTYEVM